MPAKVVEGKVVDSYYFSGPAGKVLAAAIPQEPQYDHIPWTPLEKASVSMSYRLAFNRRYLNEGRGSI